MGRGLVPFRVGHFGHAVHRNSISKRDPDASCSSGGFYKSPTSGQVVNTTDSFNITWDNTCLNTTAVDIYLYAPGANNSRIQVWQTVDFASGSYQTTLKPKWWNSTQSINLQLNIVESGTPPFLATLPAGPIFAASYTPPTSGSVSADADTTHPDSGITVVNNLAKSGGLSKGAVAAAVIFPLLFVAIGLAVYIKFSRVKEAEKRKRWSQAVDKRMSTIASDWKSLSPAGAEAAIRHSIAVSGNRSSTLSGNRSSTLSYAPSRPSSTFALESGQAGIGAGKVNAEDPEMAQIRRPGVGPRGARTSVAAERVSRISFAADTRFARPSLEGRRAGAATRSFHTAIVPPLPTLARSPSDGGSDDDAGAMSPLQRDGPLTLSTDDIRARMSGHAGARASLDEVLPALSLMRTGDEGGAGGVGDVGGELLFAPPPAYPPPAKSPVMDAMPMQPPAGALSPDEMMRAYAERRALSPATPAFPAPVAGGGGMRTLYAPSSASVSSLPTVGSNNPFRQSMAVSAHRFSGADDHEHAYAQ